MAEDDDMPVTIIDEHTAVPLTHTHTMSHCHSLLHPCYANFSSHSESLDMILTFLLSWLITQNPMTFISRTQMMRILYTRNKEIWLV